MVKNGQKHISTKKEVQIRPEDVFGDALKLDSALQAEISEAGMEARFVDAKKLYEFNGYHANGWTAFRRKSPASIEFKHGNDPDGVVRRGSLILAVRPKEVCEKHRMLLAQRAKRSRAVTQTKAAELRQMAQEQHATSVGVSEGYEENE